MVAIRPPLWSLPTVANKAPLKNPGYGPASAEGYV